jgi:hypothetical protein
MTITSGQGLGSNDGIPGSSARNFGSLNVTAPVSIRRA